VAQLYTGKMGEMHNGCLPWIPRRAGWRAWMTAMERKQCFWHKRHRINPRGVAGASGAGQYRSSATRGMMATAPAVPT
jgi:hypothetical protein